MKGFTLIEILIVICIIGILAAIAKGAFDQAEERQVERVEQQTNGYDNCVVIVTDDFGYEQKRIPIDCSLLAE